MDRVITIQTAVSAGQLVPAREPGSRKGPRRSETAQAVASVGKFVPGNPGRAKARGVRRVHKLHQRWYE